jgi:hypothetical protein
VSSDPDDLVAALHELAADGAFKLLQSWKPTIDWAGLPGGYLALADGGRLRFDKRRRSASIERPGGGITVIDLGRRDRMRSRSAIVTPDLVRIDGPDLEVALTPAWSEDRGEASVRDPLDSRGKRATTSVPVGRYRTSRYVDPTGRPLLLAVGELEAVSGFGTFLMDGGGSYAHLRTSSGLGAFSDAGRVSFMKAVTDELIEQARAEGFAQVVTKAGPIGVLFDCGAPGDYLALASYDAATGGTIGVVVDLRRPPVHHGAIVDPAST